MPFNPQIVTPQLIDHLESLSRSEQSLWLLLEPSQEFRGYWQVDGLWPEWFIELEPYVGHYRLVAPAGLEEFLETAGHFGYKVAFVEDPAGILDSYDVLKQDPVVALTSDLEETVQGFLPWQVIGFNKLIKDESIKAGYAVWDTGTGKTAFIAAAIKYHREIGHPFTLALIVAKSHNKIELQRKLLRLAGIESIIIEGYKPEKRYEKYAEIQDRLKNGEQVVAITNYEKFREDPDYFNAILKKQECLFFWDEMPTKLSNMNTRLYRSVKNALYSSFSSRPRPKWMRHWILSATPIENSPADVFACINLIWPNLLGSWSEFKNIHAGPPHPLSKEPTSWHRLDRLEAKLAFMVHRVSKEDQKVREMFPSVIPKEKMIDWNPKHRAIYDKLTGKAVDLLEQIEDANILALIQTMQMVCDAPSMIKQSAINREAFQEALMQADVDDLPFAGPRGSEIAMTLVEHLDPRTLTDVGHTKLDMWREIIVEKHPTEKIVTHSTWAQYIFPVWEHWLQQWKIPYVIFAGTTKQRQTALDQFRSDPNIRVFLSGDAGADSIDIAEASVGVNYNIPWKWTTLRQREGRRDRVNSTFDTIYTYTLVMPDSVDERKLEICERKHAYHAEIFDNRVHLEAVSTKMTKQDLWYILTGSK